MRYVLKQTLRLSFDGINVRTYKAGEPYEPAANHERRVFEDLVRKGKADRYYSPSKVSEPKAVKVVPPTQEKAPQEPKTAPKPTPKKKKKSE
jgi:hypothetical protein